ncbi:hypothetical protein BC829DRAFT_395545 [Chytridium lagenaria]|nr:hypothetical protein BC829DRAFT_395545 [Chytridium lagenaria]
MTATVTSRQNPLKTPSPSPPVLPEAHFGQTLALPTPTHLPCSHTSSTPTFLEPSSKTTSIAAPSAEVEITPHHASSQRQMDRSST